MNPTEATQKMRAVIRRQHKSMATEDSYVGWLRRYMGAVRQMPEALTSEQKLERFLTDLALRSGVAASTQNQAFHAIRFFYGEVLQKPLKEVDALRAQRPAHLRHAPTVEEVRQIITASKDVGGYPTNLIIRLLYGCGLRVTEPLNLRIKDVDAVGQRITLRSAKGGKDRVVALPCSVMEEISGQIQCARAVWQRDVQIKMPLEIPHQLAAKYPEYKFAWPWAWLFPSHWPCKHPRTGELVRYRMHESNVQRAVKEARRKLGIMVLPHELRHAYATHNLNSGVNIKALQAAMGHADVNTTLGYCHAEACSVPSPLDAGAGVSDGSPWGGKTSAASADCWSSGRSRM
jgi:integron integrase